MMEACRRGMGSHRRAGRKSLSLDGTENILRKERFMPVQITSDLKQNINHFEALFSDCADIKKRNIKIGQKLEQECYIAYIEVALSSVDWKDSAVGKLLQTLRELPEQELVS